MKIILAVISIVLFSTAVSADEIVLTPYNPQIPVDSIDENGVAGTRLARITLKDGDISSPDAKLTLSDKANFTITEHPDGSRYLTNTRAFDYETGERSFPLDITLTNGQGSLSRKLTIGVRPKNDNPARSKNITLSMAEDTSVTIDLRALGFVSDKDIPAQKNYWGVNRIAVLPVNGVLTHDSSGTFFYDPAEAGREFAADSFAYYVDDSTSYDVTKLRSQSPYWVRFTIRNTNDEPVSGTNDTILVNEGDVVAQTQYNELSLLANDRDLDNDIDRDNDNKKDITSPLSTRLLGSGETSQGSLSIAADGTFSYTHVKGGKTEQFHYEVSDGISFDTVSVTIIISLENNFPPTVNMDTLILAQGERTSLFPDGKKSLFQFISDKDLPDDTITITPWSGSTLTGTATISSTGLFIYEHNGKRIFNDEIPLTVKDAAGHTVTTAVTVKIIPSETVPLTVELSPLNGQIPNLYTFPSSMIEQCLPGAFSFRTGTICDVIFSRTIEPEDLTVEAAIYDMVGNKVNESEYPTEKSYSFKAAPLTEKNGVRLIWNGANKAGREVGGGTYLTRIVITDNYTGEKVSGKTLWGIKTPPIEDSWW